MNQKFMDSGKEAWDWLMASQGRGIHPGLERMERLLGVLGNPERGLKALHVAGTNGKGSVCAFAEAVLRVEGYRTGLYTSPHLVEFAERIRINGMPVGEADQNRGIERLREATRGWEEQEMPTFFELVTALAFDLFTRAECDIVVLETGLGGRLDATNTAPKIACAITPIGRDHTEWLGETLREIAGEKAGIFRPLVPAVIAPQHEEAARALTEIAAERRVPCHWVKESLPDDVVLGLAGSHQRENASLALALLRAGGLNPDDESVRKGFAGVSWPGRFQRLREGELILDGAHNLEAVRCLVATWREEFGSRKCRLIFGALSDKDPHALLSLLETIAEEIFLVPVASARSMPPERLAGKLQTPFCLCESLVEAFAKAFSLPAMSKDPWYPASRSPVLLTGSLFLVGEALALQEGKPAIPRSQ